MPSSSPRLSLGSLGCLSCIICCWRDWFHMTWSGHRAQPVLMEILVNNTSWHVCVFFFSLIGGRVKIRALPWTKVTNDVRRPVCAPPRRKYTKCQLGYKDTNTYLNLHGVEMPYDAFSPYITFTRHCVLYEAGYKEVTCHAEPIKAFICSVHPEQTAPASRVWSVYTLIARWSF